MRPAWKMSAIANTMKTAQPIKQCKLRGFGLNFAEALRRFVRVAKTAQTDAPPESSCGKLLKAMVGTSETASVIARPLKGNRLPWKSSSDAAKSGESAKSLK
jgi:hypothetical protein